MVRMANNKETTYQSVIFRLILCIYDINYLSNITLVILHFILFSGVTFAFFLGYQSDVIYPIGIGHLYVISHDFYPTLNVVNRVLSIIHSVSPG